MTLAFTPSDVYLAHIHTNHVCTMYMYILTVHTYPHTLAANRLKLIILRSITSCMCHKEALDYNIIHVRELTMSFIELT